MVKLWTFLKPFFVYNLSLKFYFKSPFICQYPQKYDIREEPHKLHIILFTDKSHKALTDSSSDTKCKGRGLVFTCQRNEEKLRESRGEQVTCLTPRKLLKKFGLQKLLPPRSLFPASLFGTHGHPIRKKNPNVGIPLNWQDILRQRIRGVDSAELLAPLVICSSMGWNSWISVVNGRIYNADK